MKLAQLKRMLHLMQLRLDDIMPDEQRLLDELIGCQERIGEAIEVFRTQPPDRPTNRCSHCL